MRAKLAVLALSTCFVAVGANEAFADLVRAQSVSDLLNGTAILNNNAAPATGQAVSINDLYAFDVTASGISPANGTQGVNVIYSPNSPAGEVSFFLVAGAQTTGVNLLSLDFFRDADFDQNNGIGRFATVSPNIAINPGKLDLRLRWEDLTFNGGMQPFELSAYDSVRVTFQYTTPGTSRLQVDYIANPEPGTIALFALGAAGLGGMALRRRNAKKLAAVKS